MGVHDDTDPEYIQVDQGEIVSTDPHAQPEHDDYAPGYLSMFFVGTTLVAGMAGAFYVITRFWMWWLGL